MIRNVKLQMRFSTSRDGAKHKVYSLQIPRRIIREAGWRKGDVVCVSFRAGTLHIILRKVSR